MRVLSIGCTARYAAFKELVTIGLTIFLIVVAGHNALGVNDSGYEVFRIFSASLFLLSMIPVAFELAEVYRNERRLCIESFCMLLFLAALVLLTLLVTGSRLYRGNVDFTSS